MKHLLNPSHALCALIYLPFLIRNVKYVVMGFATPVFRVGGKRTQGLVSINAKTVKKI